MLESLYSQEKVDELREYEAEARGAFDMLLSLVRDNSITKSIAAKKLGMTLAEFEKKYKEFAKVAVL